jgi:farnesyl diphosphate synthase
MRYAVTGGGKRFRPYLLIESARMFGTPISASVNAAAALECVHAYSLAHDDLPAMDDDDMRRGRPSLHKAYDEATAILAGDALLALAFEVMSDIKTHPDAAVRSELVSGLAKAAGYREMVEGQALDMEAKGKALDETARDSIASKKTGALIAYAIDAGAIIGGASADERKALAGYAKALGLAFQIADDIEDGASPDPEKDEERLSILHDTATEALVPFGERAEALRAAMRFIARR